MMNVDSGCGSARRRRERQLRSWWRQERMSIAAALVEATHHSAPRSGWPGTHQALRGQTTTSAQVDPTYRRGRRRRWAARTTASAACAAGGSATAGGAHADKSTCVRTKAGRRRRGSSCLGSGGVFLGAILIEFRGE